jgi:predicted metal-dependent hydrolase
MFFLQCQLIYMMSKKIKTYPLIGDVDFVKSRRARKITLSVRPGRNVRMTMPWHAAYRDAETFLLRPYGLAQREGQPGQAL